MVKWHLIFWEPTASPHKVDLFRALSQSDRVASCIAVAQEDVSAGRKKLGWQVGDADRARFIVGPTPEQVSAIVAAAPPDAVHIFSGIRHFPCITQALDLALAGRLRFGIMSEPRVSEGLSGIARLAQSLLTEGRIRRHAAFVLAIGRNGPIWFRMSGYRKDRIFPYAYFIAPAPAPVGRAYDGQCLRVAYLGRLEVAKGISLFLDAISRVEVPVAVTIAGAGSQESTVRSAMTVAQTPINFVGALPMTAVPHFLQNQDVLVVPSTTTDDGWGVVIGEALMSGTAVVATTKVGASSCLNCPGNGIAVSTLESAAIARAITALAASDLLNTNARKMRTDWALENLTGNAGAARLLSVLDHVFDGGGPPADFPPSI